MARQVSYQYKGVEKLIPFARDRFEDIYHAVAAAEGVDITSILVMEQQVAAVSSDRKAARQYRQQAFAKLGFAAIHMVKS